MLTFSLETGPIYHYAVAQFRTFNIWDTFTYFDVTKNSFINFIATLRVETSIYLLVDWSLISKKWECVFEHGPPKYNFRGFSLKNFLLGKVKICWVFFCSDSMHLSYQDVLFPYTSFLLKSRYFKVCPTRQWYSGKGSKMTLSQVLLTHSSFWVCSKSLKIDSSELQTPL